jgi:hypothetical protein
MLRLALSAFALAGVLATAQPAFADPLAASDRAQATAPATEQPALLPGGQTWSPSTDVTVPTSAGASKDVPVGFGWG